MNWSVSFFQFMIINNCIKFKLDSKMYSSSSQKRKVIKVKSDIAIASILFALEDHISIKEYLPCKKKFKGKRIEQSNLDNTKKDINIFDSILLKNRKNVEL